VSKRNKALVAIIACVLFWGFSFISIKITVAVFPPMSLGMLRFAIALVILYFIKLKLAPAEKLSCRDIPLLLGAGVSGVTLYFFFENNGVSLVTASEASIAIGSIPVLIMVSDWFSQKINRDKNNNFPQLGIRQWLGALISIVGVWLVAGVSFAISGSALGYIYMAGAALSWAVYSLLTRPLFARCSRIYIVFWQTVAGFICFIPFSVMELNQWGRPDLPVILHLIFLGICCSALGYWLYAHSLEVLGMSVSAIFINLIPLFTVIFGFFVMNDRLSLLQWCGATLVIGGVYLSMGVKRGIKTNN
jgi:drug/metabolite transporter (DMT)-like permease